MRARSPLPRSFLNRLETGRLVLYSLLAGLLVGLLGALLQLLIGALLDLGALVIGYRPPGAAGEGGLLIAFGQMAPYGLLLLPLVGAVYAGLLPTSGREPLAALVGGYHAGGRWPRPLAQLGTLIATLLGQAGGLLVGRDSSFTALGSLSALLLSRLARLQPAEVRTLTLASAAAALGLALHAPLPAAVLVAEVLYRRFEFEFEVLMPCVLAAVAASAVSGLIFGAAPLLELPSGLGVGLGDLPAYLLLGLAITAAALAVTLLAARLPEPRGLLRLALGAVFGGLTALLALQVTPSLLGGGSGWFQLGVSGFLGLDGGLGGLWRTLLLLLGVRLAFGGGVLVSSATGGLLGVGLGSVMAPLLQSWGLETGLDLPVAALVGATAFLSVTLNVPAAATLLAVTWGGESLLPVALLTAGLAHSLSGEATLVRSQVSRRTDSSVHETSLTVLGRAPGAATVLAGPGLGAAGLSAVGPGATGLTPANSAAAARSGEPRPEEAPGSADLAGWPAGLRLSRVPAPRAWMGARLDLLTLPARHELLGVVRGGVVRLAEPGWRLRAGDELLLLAPALPPSAPAPFSPSGLPEPQPTASSEDSSG